MNVGAILWADSSGVDCIAPPPPRFSESSATVFKPEMAGEKGNWQHLAMVVYIQYIYIYIYISRDLEASRWRLCWAEGEGGRQG